MEAASVITTALMLPAAEWAHWSSLAPSVCDHSGTGLLGDRVQVRSCLAQYCDAQCSS